MRAALLSLLLALPLFAQPYSIDPVAPTDRSFVVLKIRDIWRDGCVPRGERVTRNGNAFTVQYEVPLGVACPAVLTRWNADAPLGALSAGVYSVTVEVHDFQEVRTMATLTFVVTEAAPELQYSPRIASTAGGTEITFPNLCAGTVAVDGVTVPFRIENCDLIATLPPHAAGPVDVRVITPARTVDIVNAVRYVDPAATPDASLYERVLIPVLFNGPGAFGSQWETEVVMQAGPLGVLPAVSAPLRTNASLQTLFGNRATGLVLFLPRDLDARFTSHIRDVSRDASQWGTEMPVVRERDTRPMIVLQNVPFDPRYRPQLRIYGIDGVGTPVTVSSGIAHRSVPLRGPCSAIPCNSSEPAYASVDLGQLFPELTGRRTVVIEQFALQPQRIWAFVTVTNNETQHVTVISPQ